MKPYFLLFLLHICVKSRHTQVVKQSIHKVDHLRPEDGDGHIDSISNNSSFEDCKLLNNQFIKVIISDLRLDMVPTLPS